MSDHNNIYSIIGKLNALTPKQETVAETKKVYESVEPKGSVLEGVKSVESRLNEKYTSFKTLEETTIDDLAESDEPTSWKAIVGAILGGAAGMAVGGGNPLIGAAGAYGGYKIGQQGLDQDAAYKQAQKEKQQQAKANVQEATQSQLLFYAKGPQGEKIYASCDDQSQCSALQNIFANRGGEMKVFSLQDPEIQKWLSSRTDQQFLDTALAGNVIMADAYGKQSVKQLRDVLAMFKATPAPTATPVNTIAEEICDECGMYESHCGCDHKEMYEGRETLKTKSGTIYKGGKYGTEYSGDDEGKKKAKVAGQGRGRPKKEQPAEYSKSNDPFGRVPDKAPKGKKGTVVKGKGNIDTVDEVINKKSSAGDIIHDFVHSKNPKFAGKSKTQRTKQALGAYYGMHPEKSNVKESTFIFVTGLMESVNFQKMVQEANMTVEEMLECINKDIQAYKTTGDMTERLRDFMHLHNHMKKMQEASSLEPQKPTGQDILPKQSTLGKMGSTVKKALTGPSDEELLAQLQQQEQPQRSSTMQELDELAQLAGITDEGNEFSGELAKARADHKDSFEVDGKTYPVKEATSLADIARLSGIFQEAKDYGDTSFNEAPHYDNSPDEQVMGVEVQTQGGDGEVAGAEKDMNSGKPTWKNADNPLGESKNLIKPATEFNFVKEMGRDLIQAYQGIKTK